MFLMWYNNVTSTRIPLWFPQSIGRTMTAFLESFARLAQTMLRASLCSCPERTVSLSSTSNNA